MGVCPIESNQAWILEPVLLPGKETGYKWKQVIMGILKELRSHICAMVSYGFKGGNTLDRKHGWAFQRYHFHLTVLLKDRHGKKDDVVAHTIEKKITRILQMRDWKEIETSLLGLRHLAESQQGPQRIKGIARDFIYHIQDFFCFMNYPEYHLPTTNKSMESYASLFRDKLYNISTPKALGLWIRGFIKLRKRIKCNGHLSTKI
jgi:hypothetical protein